MHCLHMPPKVERNGQVTVITFTGRRNRAAGNPLARELDGRTERRRGSHLLLDFIHIEFVTGADLGTLITLHTKTRAAGVRLTLFNLNTHVYEVFLVTKLHTLFEVLREK